MKEKKDFIDQDQFHLPSQENSKQRSRQNLFNLIRKRAKFG
jgi:hypothetical protein